MMSLRTFLVAAATAFAVPGSPGAIARADQVEDHTADLHVHDAYARVGGAAGASGAVFFLVHNNTALDLRIVAAKAGAAKRVELHTHVMTADGIMQMREIEGGVPLAAGKTHAFERGADHVMLMGLTADLKDGDIVPVTLVMDDGSEVTFDAVIDNARKPEKATGHGHSGG